MLSFIISDFWHDPDSRREVLTAFAREKGFDALVPVNWYNIPKEDIADLQVLPLSSSLSLLPLSHSMLTHSRA